MTEGTHYCTQEEAIKRMSHILVGNGHPEDSLAFKQAQTSEDIKDIKELLHEIKSNYAGLSDSLKTFKAELKGRDDANNKSFSKTIQIVGVIVAFLGVIGGMVIGFNKTNSKTEELRNYVETVTTPMTLRGGTLLDTISFY